MFKLYATLILCALLTVAASQRGMGWGLLALSAAFVAWLVIAAYMLFKRKSSPRLQLAKACVWLIGLTVAASAHAYMYTHARSDAVRVSAAAEAFFAAHGKYPCSMSDIGFVESDDRDHRRLADLYCLEGEPHLWYFSSFRPYEMAEYDFAKHKWNEVESEPD